MLTLPLFFLAGVGYSQSAEEDRNRGSVRELYEEGALALDAGDYETALEIFQAVVEIRPAMPQVHNLIGVVNLKQGETGRAIASFLKAVEYDPKYAEGYFNLATVYMGSTGDRELAEEYYRKTIEIDPKFGRAYFGLGWLQLLAYDNVTEAIDLFKQVIAIVPDYAEGYYGLGMAYVRADQTELSLEPISKLRALSREDLAMKIEAAIKEGEEPFIEEPIPVSDVYAGGYPGEVPLEEEPPLPAPANLQNTAENTDSVIPLPASWE